MLTEAKREYHRHRMRIWREMNPGYYKTEAWKSYQAAWSKNWRAAHPVEAVAKQRRNVLVRTCRKYGLLVEEYSVIAERGCEICGEMPHGTGKQQRLYFDHDHRSDEFRGILCSACNLAIGRFDKSHDRLMRVVTYLKDEGADHATG